MGSGKSSTPSLPPPPTPVATGDVATTAAENALAAQSKASYASTTEDKKKAPTLGDVAAPAPRKREAAPASMVPASTGSLGASSVLTG
jgi:hypothetical protein